MADRDIACVFHGRYGVLPEQIPCCPICDLPMLKGERLQLEYCDMGPGQQDAARLIHLKCDDTDDDD